MYSISYVHAYIAQGFESIHILFHLSDSVFDSDLVKQWRAPLAQVICGFVRWYASCLPASQSLLRQNLAVTVRDVLKWIAFVNSTICNLSQAGESPSPIMSLVHGCALAFLDALPNTSPLKACALECLHSLILSSTSATLPTASQSSNLASCLSPPTDVRHSENLRSLHIGPFTLPVSDPDAVRKAFESSGSVYSFDCPTTALNLMRLARALQLCSSSGSGSAATAGATAGASAILLEGSPGVGKTSLVLELGRALGVRVLRVNLSEQTEVSDLVGRDLPRPASTECSSVFCNDGSGTRDSLSGEFEWCDGPLLTALKLGAWILFDEV